MNERIKILRNTLNLSMEKFGAKIGLTKSAISKFESGANPSAQTIILICSEFNVNEQWLRTGEGEMFVQMSREEELAMLLGNLLTDEAAKYKRAIISTMLRMDDNAWTALDHFLDELIEQRKNIT